MPRLDGKLYEYEKAALKPKREPKRMGRPPKPKPPEPIIQLAQPAERKKPGPKREDHELAPKDKGGRPTVRRKLTRAEVDKVVGHIRQGLPVESACVLVGIGRAVFDKWKRLNPALQLEFERAENEFENDLVSRINVFAKDDLKAATWLLERRIYQRWAQVTKSELTGKDGGPIQQTTLSKQLLASVGGKGDGYVTERKRKGPLPATATEHGTTNQVIDVTANVVTQHDAKHDASSDVAK